MNKIGNSWDEILFPLTNKESFSNLSKEIAKQREMYNIYPKENDVFKAFSLTSYNDVLAVIIGQDPYHEENQANGLAFSVNENVKIPPSLRNIYKELESDLGITVSKNGDLTPWAKRGVLLLNATLTVREGKANSHQKLGWQEFTDGVISLLSKREKPMVFILWGNNAIAKKALIDSHHHIITSVHPSPLSASRGFFGSKPFSKANEFLKTQNEFIDWTL